MVYWRNAISLLGPIWVAAQAVAAFLPPPPPPRGKSPLFSHHGDNSDSQSSSNNLVQAANSFSNNQDDESDTYTFLNNNNNNNNNNNTVTVIPRGGSTKSKATQVKHFWSDAFTKPIKATQKKVKNAFKSKEQRQQEQLMEKLVHMPVQLVTVPNSTVLPPDFVQWAAQQAGMVGQPLRTERVQRFGELLQQWYQSRGYVLHRVTGATLRAESGTAEVTTDEPIVSYIPVAVTGCQEMIVDDDEAGTLLTPRQYKDKHQQRKTFGFDKLKRDQLNTTYVPTAARVRPQRIAKALGLQPGQPFVWDAQRWAHVSSSRIFRKVLQATPQPLSDGSVQLNIIAAEAPTRHLEYGVGKSLYTDSWEGELEFEHLNILGGGETLGLSLRRGTKDVEPSVRLRFADEKFGMTHGYEVEAFTNYIGEFLEDVLSSDGSAKLTDEQGHALLNRKGATFRFRNPLDPSIVRNTLLTTSVERISARNGMHESVVSTGLGVGPIVQNLPLDARQSADLTVTLASRYGEPGVVDAVSNTPWFSPARFKPYSTITASVKHLFPIINTAGQNRRPLVLALRHSATTSTRHIPKHESQALGVMSSIRGSTPNTSISTAIRGSTEIRFPVNLPMLKGQQDASVVLFSDWLLATKAPSTPFFRKSAVGIGIRKSLQGIPLKYDISFSKDGKIKTAFGLGADFLL